MEPTEKGRSARPVINFIGKTLRKSIAWQRDVRIEMKNKTEVAAVMIDTESAKRNILNVF